MILELIKQSRSHRNFTDKKISEEDILKILECTRYSSNAKNSQDLRFSYTIDDEKTKEIFKNISLGGALSKEDKPIIEERPRGIITILTEKNNTKSEKTLYYDIGIVSQNIALMAKELDYSTCILLSFKQKELCEIMNIPKGFEIKAVIVLGKSKDKVEIIDIEDKNLAENFKYYRKNGIHYLPKLKLEDLIIKEK